MTGDNSCQIVSINRIFTILSYNIYIYILIIPTSFNNIVKNRVSK